ncbi:unnamed protein product [Onchocerca ochengi]|uniref:ZP domain-containing protein n=1 Tax=Onchocerca ochengi TaxID=42157 RepID=A0A182EDE3_ONCOC|nr:unnamed protein product [Onchocerca ochengi]
MGRTFVKGYIQDSNCFQTGNHHELHKFTIKFNQCGLRRSREIFLTKVDRAYRLNCFYMESSKTITQQLEISMMTTQELRRQTQMPICRYEILSGGATGIQVRYAKVGDSVYHRWTCLAETNDLYCMRVHTCTVSDGQGGETIEVLDKKGCSVDKYLLMDLEYTDDLTAGQESHVFKFADRSALYFNCQLELTTKDYSRGCANERPICKGQVQVKPSEQPYERSATNTAEMEETQTSVYEDSNKQKNYPNPTDLNYKSNELSYQNNGMIHPSPSPPAPPVRPLQSSYLIHPSPSPPAPPVRLSQPFYFQSSSKSIYSIDSDDKNISTSSQAEAYGQLPLETGEEAHETTVLYKKRIAYKRLIRRRRNSKESDINLWKFIADQHFSSTPAIILRPKLQRIANVDLPEQCITVFDIEDENNEEIQSANLNRLFNPIKTSRTCFSTARLTMLLAVAMVTFTIFILVLIFALRKRRIFLDDDFIK